MNSPGPAGWGYIAENNSDDEEAGRASVCPPDPPQTQQSLSDFSQPPRPQTASLHQVIQALHERAAQPSPSIATLCKRRQYGSAAFCYKQSSDGMIRCEMSSRSKKQLARRGGHWDVVGEDQSDSKDNECDEDDDNLEELRDHLWNISFSM